AQARHPQASVPDGARCAVRRNLLQQVSPRGDPRDAGPSARVDHAEQVGAAHGGGVQAEALQARARRHARPPRRGAPNTPPITPPITPRADTLPRITPPPLPAATPTACAPS